MSKRFFIIICISLFLFGCSAFPDTSNDIKFSENQVLRLAESQEIATLDSAKAKDVSSMNILNNVQEGLLRQGKGKKPEYGIAYDYEISSDNLKYIFKLREDAVWSDGKKVTAHDFEYAWKRVLNPKTNSEYAYIMYPIKNAEAYNQGKVSAKEVGIKALDDYTLEVTLEKPMFNFIHLTTTPTFLPQRKDIVEKYQDQYGLKETNMVYNGPFIVQEWKPSKVVLQRNEQYWDMNAVTLETVEIYIVKDHTTGINFYNAGQVETAQLNNAFVDAYKRTQDYVDVEVAGTYYILLNHKNPFFKNEKIRKAISLAIDRDEITNGIMKDGSKPAGSLIPPSLGGVGTRSFRDDKEIVETNVHLAQQLFKEGLEELGMSEPPKSIVMIGYDSTAKRDVAVNIQDQLRKKLRWEIKLDSPPWKIHLDRVSRGDFDMAMLGWGADYNDPMGHFEIWLSNNPMNFSKVSIPAYDELVQQAKEETNQERQVALLKQAEEILVGVDENGKAAFVPLFYGSKAYVQKPYVKDLIRHPYGAEYTLKWAYLIEEPTNK